MTQAVVCSVVSRTVGANSIQQHPRDKDLRRLYPTMEINEKQETA